MTDVFRNEVNTKIGRRIRLARLARQLDPADLAQRSGMTRRRLDRAEAGQGDLTVDELEMIAGALRLSVVHFLAGCALCGSE